MDENKSVNFTFKLSFKLSYLYYCQYFGNRIIYLILTAFPLGLFFNATVTIEKL